MWRAGAARASSLAVIAGMSGEAWIPDTSSFAALGRRYGMTKVEAPCGCRGCLGARCETRVIPEDEPREARSVCPESIP